MPDIAIAAKRYDGGSGSAVFSGVIPLKPGQLFETDTGLVTGSLLVAKSSLRGNVSLRNADGTERQAYITALYPQHKEEFVGGKRAIKALRVSTTLSLDTASQPAAGLSLILRIGTSPTLTASPTSHPFVDMNYLRFQPLLGCVDAQHMCDSRIALGPLVPVNHAELPANWKDFLTEQFERGETMPFTGFEATNGGMSPSDTGGSFPTYKVVINQLRLYGDLRNTKMGTMVTGSNVITLTGRSWPTPTSPLSGTITVGMQIHGKGFPDYPSPYTLVTEIIDATHVRASVVSSYTGDYPVGFGFSYATQDADYNCVAPMYYRYLTAESGHLDKLHEANLMAHSWTHSYTGFVGNRAQTFLVTNRGTQVPIMYGQNYTDENGVAHTTGDVITLDQFGETSSNPAGLTAPQSGFHHNVWMCYVLTEWNQALDNIIKFGVPPSSNTWVPWTGSSPTNSKPWSYIGPGTIHHTPTSASGWDGPRFNFRFLREGDLLVYMLSLPFTVRVSSPSGGAVAPSPRVLANRADWKLWFQKRYYDSPEYWSQEFNAADTCNGFLKGLWGISPNYVQWGGNNGNCQPGTAPGSTVPPSGYVPVPSPNEPSYSHVGGQAPIFQLQMTFNALMILFCNILEDPRFVTKMGELAVWLANVQSSTHWGAAPTVSLNASAIARPGGNPANHRLPYRYVSPTLLANPPTDEAAWGKSHWHPPQAQVPNYGPPYGVWVAGYHSPPIDAYSGDLEFFNHNYYTTCIVLCLLTYGARVTGNAKCLEMADGNSTIYAMRGSNQLHGGGDRHSLKSLGEEYHMAHYAAAFRVPSTTYGVVLEATPTPISVTIGQSVDEDVTPTLDAQGGHIVSDFTFNVAKSRVRTFHDNVKNGTPSTARYVWVALTATGLVADATLKDYATLADLLAGASDEVTNSGYARLVVAAADLTTSAPSNADDWIDLDIADPVWGNIQAGTSWRKAVLCYAPDSAGADSTFIPVKAYDILDAGNAVVPNGSPVSLIVPATGYHRTKDAA